MIRDLYVYRPRRVVAAADGVVVVDFVTDDELYAYLVENLLEYDNEIDGYQ